MGFNVSIEHKQTLLKLLQGTKEPRIYFEEPAGRLRSEQASSDLFSVHLDIQFTSFKGGPSFTV
jgi:hypothetical protein